MRARSVTARVSSIKVLWPATMACIAGVIATGPVAAQPPEPVRSSEVPLISIEELARLLGDKPPITLKFTDASLKQVLDELSQQTGLMFRTLEMGRAKDKEEKPVTVDVQGKEFWPVLDELSRQMGVSFQPDHSGSGFQVWPGRAMVNPEQGSGPQSKTPLGAMRVDSVGRSRTLRWSADGKAMPNESLSLSLGIRLDPRIRVLGASYQPKLDEAIDNVGYSLAPARRAVPEGFDMHEGMGFSGGSGRQFNVSLRAPGPQTQRLTRLRGSVRLRVATRSETWEVDVDEDKPRTKTIQRDGAEISLSVGAWRRRGGVYEMELAMHQAERIPNAAPNNRRFWGFSTFGNVRLLDAQNRELSRGGSSGNGSGTGLEYRMSFSSRGGEDDAGQPAKLIWTLPTEWKDVEIPFEFSDIPLP